MILLWLSKEDLWEYLSVFNKVKEAVSHKSKRGVTTSVMAPLLLYDCVFNLFSQFVPFRLLHPVSRRANHCRSSVDG